MFWSTGPKILDEGKATEERGMVKIKQDKTRQNVIPMVVTWMPEKVKIKSNFPQISLTAAAGCWQAYIHVVHLECGVAAAHIFVADFWIFHHKSNRYFLSLSLPAANWGVRRLPKFHFHFSFYFSNVFSWDGTSVSEGPQYLNCRPGVSVIEM